ncbi:MULTISPECIES: hypothetical protein [unclassified Archaeoglobus]|jgi:hypothetical protein|uniref:hypothetical protein n=1 Tax=unclassified Archaeoglobus TaxID=2643606 RepID=UPI0025B8BD7D|nr:MULTISPECIES: hypothetical protein [unclassified Archaeoglobus]
MASVTPAEFGNVIFQLILANLELMSNTFRLLMNNSISAVEVWNVIYHAASFGYWVANSFVGDGGALDVMRENVSAMKNFTNMVSYLGGNAEVIFGNESGGEGISAVMKNVAALIDENFTIKFWSTLKLGIIAVIKLMGQISAAFG